LLRQWDHLHGSHGTICYFENASSFSNEQEYL